MKKQKVAILAPTGMLGSMVYKVFKDKYSLVLVYRDKKKLGKLETAYGGTTNHKCILFDLLSIYEDYKIGFPKKRQGASREKLMTAIGLVDMVINCAGITKPHILINPLVTLFINGALPNILSSIYQEKLIQITTDCVYDGLKGAPYDENALKNPLDLYGLSKSLGEPWQSLILRTSIVGPEINGSQLLLEWFKSQEGKTVPGYTNHLWNGMTTKQFALICDQIISKRKKFPQRGLFHIFSNSVTKYEMLLFFKEKYRLKAKIVPTESPISIDRRLASVYNLCKNLAIPSFEKMLEQL